MVFARVRINESAIERAKKRIAAISARAGSHVVSVGIHDGEKVDYHGDPSGKTIVEVAAIHEFGDRPFLRPWFDSNAPRIRREMIMAERAEFTGDKDAVHNLALRWESELRTLVTSRQANLAPLARATIAERSRAGIDQETPLYATGQLVAAIKALVDGE